MSVETKKIFSSVILVIIVGFLFCIDINIYLKTSGICLFLYIYLRYIFNLETDDIFKKYIKNELYEKIKEIMILDTYSDLPNTDSIPNHKKFYIRETKQFYINIAGNYVPTDIVDEEDFLRYLHINYIKRNSTKFKYILKYTLLSMSIISFIIYFIIKLWRIL